MTPMSFAVGGFAVDAVVLASIGAALIAGIALAAWFGKRHRVALIALQPLAAGLLLAALSVREDAGMPTLAVLTPGAEIASVDDESPLPRVALPGAPRGEGIEPVPDLATALRRHAARHLVVFGEGLRAHDRAGVGARTLEFKPSPAPPGAALIELDAPGEVGAGRWWTLRGRVHAPQGTSLVLLDPAGIEVGETTPGDDGRFALEAVARAAGTTTFELQLRRGDEVLQSLPVPTIAITAPPLRVLVLAAAPSPELKYLRRWALDAGVQLEAGIALAPGLAQRRGTVTLDAAQLAQLDLLIVDERSWPQLASLQPALRDAVEAGLGLLVRTTGPVPERVAQEWTAWKLTTPGSTHPQAVHIADSPQTSLHAWPAPAAPDAPILLAAADGTPLAQWQARGRGRVASWRVTDTHRLYTRGERERHASLWSDVFAVVARARGERRPHLPARAMLGERAVLCDLPAPSSIITPAGERWDLSIEQGCAAFWPRERGWHRLESGELSHRFHVHHPATLATLLAHERRAATEALVRGEAPAQPTASDPDRWRAMWLAAWLAVMTLVWWLERAAKRR